MSALAGVNVSVTASLPPIVAATDYVAALSEIVARPVAESLNLQLLKMPLAAGGATVQMMWHERTGASRSHGWLRDVVAEVGRSIEMSCKRGRGRSAAA